MGSGDQAREFFPRYELEDVHHFSDPDCSLYRAFGLARVPFWVLLRPHMWGRAIECARAGHRMGRPMGDAFRMPGIFLVYKGQVIKTYRHKTFDDRPDYLDLACPTGIS